MAERVANLKSDATLPRGNKLKIEEDKVLRVVKPTVATPIKATPAKGVK